MQTLQKKILRELWISHRNRLIKQHSLKLLHWETTLACNLNCKHCGSSAVRESLQDELTTNEIKDFFKKLSDDFNPNDLYIGLTGGEPLLRKDLVEIMSYAHDLGFEWTLITNGLLINNKKLNELASAGLKSLSISLDGLRKSHDDLRGVEDAWEKALNAVKLSVDFPKILKVDVLTTINSHNIGELRELFNLLRDIKINSWRLMTTDLIGRAKLNSDLQINLKQLNKALDFVAEIRKKQSEIKVSWGCSGYYGINFENEIRDNFFYCSSGINIASILYNGDILGCTDVPRKKELIQGNIRKDNFKEIWENKFNIYRDKFRLASNKCEHCKDWDFCLGGGFHAYDFERSKPAVCMKDLVE